MQERLEDFGCVACGAEIGMAHFFNEHLENGLRLLLAALETDEGDFASIR